MSADEGSRITATAPWSLRVVSFIVTLVVSAAAGSFLFRRYARAAVWLAAEVGVFILRTAFFLWSPRLLWAGLGVIFILRLLAALQMLQTARSGVPTAPLRTLIVAWVVISFFGMGLGAITKRYVVEAFQIPTTAMAPTLLLGDHIMADKRPRPVERGEAIIFRYPLDPSITYLKRVVAVGGDTVGMSHQTLTVNGQKVERRRLEGKCDANVGIDSIESIGCDLWEETLDGHRYSTVTTRTGHTLEPVQIPPGYVFVIGDNRDNSSDSRVWGPVALKVIVARPRFIWFSSGDAGIRWERVNQEVH